MLAQKVFFDIINQKERASSESMNYINLTLFLVTLLKVCIEDNSTYYYFVFPIIRCIMSVHGVAVGNLFPHVTILREPNVSNAITVVYSSPPTSLCSTLIASLTATNIFNLMQLISIHGDGTPSYWVIHQR
jgi:hypothetical protein